MSWTGSENQRKQQGVCDPPAKPLRETKPRWQLSPAEEAAHSYHGHIESDHPRRGKRRKKKKQQQANRHAKTKRHSDAAICEEHDELKAAGITWFSSKRKSNRLEAFMPSRFFTTKTLPFVDTHAYSHKGFFDVHD